MAGRKSHRKNKKTTPRYPLNQFLNPNNKSNSKPIVLFLCFVSLLLTSCTKKNDKLLFCTENFVTITLQITGKPPTDFYTIRLATGDTLRYEWIYDKYFPVADDNLVNQIEIDEIETFRFVGKRNQNSIDLRYKIKSDGCHVIKVEGLETIM